MAIKITKRTRTILEKPYFTRFWGRRTKVKPKFIDAVFGNGDRLIYIAPIMTRPQHYLIRVDSGWDLNGDEFYDELDNIYEAIEEQVGPAHWTDDDAKERHDPWPAASLDDGTCWGDATNRLPKRVRPKQVPKINLSLTQEAIESLASRVCPGFEHGKPCHRLKAPKQSFCHKCYFRLPQKARNALYKTMSDGYAQYWDEARDILKGE